MTPKEKYSEEKDEMKLARMNRILEAGFELFSEQGIDTIAMTDIAKKAEIGVASLYRYYATKDEIAIRTAIWAWNRQKETLMPEFEKEEFTSQNGHEQLRRIFLSFSNLYETQNKFLRFIYFFDSYAVRTKIEKERLCDYEDTIKSVQNVISKAINKGLKDGSINQKFIGQENSLYFTLMHSLFSLSQKLSLSGNLLQMDLAGESKQELLLLTEILLNGIK